MIAHREISPRLRVGLVLAVLVFTLPLAQRAFAQAKLADLVAVRTGTLPIVISAPHGGRQAIEGAPQRKGDGVDKFVATRDERTFELAERVAEVLEKKLAGKPHLVAARFERKFVDPNRPPQDAYESDLTKPYYEAYHRALGVACETVRKDWGRGLVVDIHGQAASAKAIFRGTNNGKTVSHLVGRFGQPALVGPESVFGVLAKRGYEVIPANDSADSEDKRYGGGFIVQTYGSKQGGTLDAIQLELGTALRTKQTFEQTAEDIAEAVAVFAKAYLPLERAEAKQRPNVIVLLTDDMGYGDLSCHGNPVVKTPHIDELYRRSIRLTDFHVAPMCTPTRGQLMTGLDALRNGASSVSAGRSFVRRGIPTMAESFAATGYKTALFGKWHLGDSYPNLPHFKGFHESVYHLGWGITSMADLWQNDLFDGRFRHNGVLEKYPGYCTDVWFDLSLKWIKERQAKREPFFLYLPTNAPHGPHWVAEKYKKPYEGKGPAAFFGMIANVDENVGRLDALLKETGLLDNTIVIYMHDNGATAGAKTFNAGLRGTKTQHYEGGHRAPCFISWPAGGLHKPGDLDALTEIQDLFPTLIDLCGLKTPERARFDGQNLAPMLGGKVDAPVDRMLVVQYGEQPNGAPLEKGKSAVMWNKWRLVHATELYDLKTDPEQKTNVAAKFPDVAKQLGDHYEKWWSEIEAGTNDFEPVSIGSDHENPVTLTSADWARIYCDNMQNLRAGKPANGPWHVLVEKDGDYEIELRRWPKEADAPLSAGVPAFKAVDGGLPAGVALPIAKVRLKVAGLDETRDVKATDKGIVFHVSLKAGPKIPMQSWCYDSAGKELCGAYFAYVRRK